jgi:hypothetical protein
MRISTWLHLAVLCFVVGSFSASPLVARPPVPKSNTPLIRKEFQGYGLTPKDAEANALECACEWLAVHANLRQPPTPDFLREKGMVHFVGEPNEREFVVAKDFAKDGKMKVVTLQLEITAEQARDIHKQDTQLRMKDRQKLSLFTLIGAMGLLGVVGSYLRLEEATKGYYTRLLRLAAISALVVIVAGLCVAG